MFKLRFTPFLFYHVLLTGVNFGIVSVHEKKQSIRQWYFTVGFEEYEWGSNDDGGMIIWIWMFGLFQLLFYTHIIATDTDWEWKDNR